MLWERHCCLPRRSDADVGELGRYARAGGAFVSVNVGYAPRTAAEVRGLLILAEPVGHRSQVRAGGGNDASLDAVVRHIDYAVDLLRPQHVGVSTDYPFDVTPFLAGCFSGPMTG